MDFEQASAPIYIYIYVPEKRGRKPGTSWNGEMRVERMGGISSGVGGGGGSARLY